MADQNQDLPLVVSESLIEMHELRGDIKELQKVTGHLSHSVEKLQIEMHDVKGAITQLAGSIKTLAEESRGNTEMMIAAFRKEGLYGRQLCNSTMPASPNWKITSPTNKQQTLWAASY